MELLGLLLIFYLFFSSCTAEIHIAIGEGGGAKIGQFPFYAQIIIGFSATTGAKCGAAIIHERWLLSAAHCFEDPILNLSVLGGTNKNFEVNGEKYLVEKVVKHEKFFIDSMGVPHYDIALIRLKSYIRFSTNIQPITLPKNDSTKFDGDSVTIPGMGMTYTSREPSILQFIHTEVIPLDQCRLMQHPGFPGEYIEDAKLCTSVKNGKMTCQGDSGGPVVAKGVLIGIVSHGFPLCLPGSPDVHTRVSSHLDWIKKNMNLYSDILLD